MDGLPKTDQPPPTPKLPATPPTAYQFLKMPPEHTTANPTATMPVSRATETDGEKPLLTKDILSSTSTAPPRPTVRHTIRVSVPRDQEFPRKSRFSNLNFDLERMHQSRLKSKRCCCCIFFIIVFVVAIVVIMSVYISNIQPPQFFVDSVSIIGLDLKTAGTISPQINATLISHESKLSRFGAKGSATVFYSDSLMLCRGFSPKFTKSANELLMVGLEFKCMDITLPMTDRTVMMEELKAKKLTLFFDVKAPLNVWKFVDRVLRAKCQVEVGSLSGQAKLHPDSKQCSSELVGW